MNFSFGKRRSRGRRIKLDKDSWVTGVLLLVFVGVLFYTSIRSVSTSIAIVQSRGWVQTPCAVTKVSHKSESRRSSRRRGSRHYTVYVPQAEYRYQFGGQTYQGNTYLIKKYGYRSRSKADRMVAKLKSQRSTYCYVNPTDPNESTLRLNSLTNLFISLVPLTFFGIVSAILASFASQKLGLDD